MEESGRQRVRGGRSEATRQAGRRQVRGGVCGREREKRKQGGRGSRRQAEVGEEEGRER